MVNFTFECSQQTISKSELSQKNEEQQERWETSLFFKNQEKEEEEGEVRMRKKSGSFYENLDSESKKEIEIERFFENKKDFEIERYSDIAQRLAASPTTAV